MSEIHELAASYALNALDAAELAEFEAHLATCQACQDDVAEFCETAAELSLLSMATPPDSLRHDIVAAIRDTPQLPADDQGTAEPPGLPVAAEPRTPQPSGPRRAIPGSEVADEPEPSQVDELAQRRQRRRTRVLSGLVAAVLALAIGLGGVIYTLVQDRQAEIASQALEDELLRAPDATVVVVDASNGGRASFIVSRARNRALFLGTDMPDPGQGQRYQLWTVTGTLPNIDPDLDNPVEDDGAERRQFFRGDVANADALAISIEPDGSTPETPSKDPVVIAPLPE